MRKLSLFMTAVFTMTEAGCGVPPSNATLTANPSPSFASFYQAYAATPAASRVAAMRALESATFTDLAQLMEPRDKGLRSSTSSVADGFNAGGSTLASTSPGTEFLTRARQQAAALDERFGTLGELWRVLGFDASKLASAAAVEGFLTTGTQLAGGESKAKAASKNLDLVLGTTTLPPPPVGQDCAVQTGLQTEGLVVMACVGGALLTYGCAATAIGCQLRNTQPIDIEGRGGSKPITKARQAAIDWIKPTLVATGSIAVVAGMTICAASAALRDRGVRYSDCVPSSDTASIVPAADYTAPSPQ